MIARFFHISIAALVWSCCLLGNFNFAHSQSFSCNDQSLTTEKLICGNTELGILDEQVAALFSKLKEHSQGSAKKRLVDQQQRFLKARDYGCLDFTCIKNAYEIRRNELDKLAQINGMSSTRHWVNITAKDHPQMDYCHMDACSWFVVKKKKNITKNINGELFEFAVMWGETTHYVVIDPKIDGIEDDEYPDGFSEAVPIEWTPESKQLFVYCSKKLPVFIEKKTNKFVVTAMFDSSERSFGAGPGAEDAGLYVSICDRQNPNGFGGSALDGDHGYRRLPEKFETQFNSLADFLATANLL